MIRVLLCGLVLAMVGCDAAPSETPPRAAPEPPDEAAPQETGVPLGVPPEQIHRARREVVGLERMPASLRQQTLAARRDPDSPNYAALREDADVHAHAAVRFSGRVGLAQPAGDRLWILALHTRQEGDEWRDPLYVLSVVDPEVPADGGVRATVHGWVVGERTIGQHALPLIVAYAVLPERE
ncbi:MAG: hypothetical protein AB8I08_36305 [Sandaracinaceae bacterium]